ncbi:hypothetical protein B0H14DRAFT_3731538 [Mycena olivaceomarginata]|nr:hypothetical protein B0H14DRAFT_3731538 [Mycena olivaceomarginata]
MQYPRTSSAARACPAKAASLPSVRLTSILEEPVCLPETSAAEAALKKAKKNSMKARRRLGVSNLSPLLNDSEWSLRLPACLGEDSSFDFPRPPIPVFESEASSSDESSSGSDEEGARSGSESPMPATPTQSPSSAACDFVAVAAELQQGARVLRRCKTIKPLVIAKRAVSPLPPSQDEEKDSDSDNDAAWQDDDEYYASHASGFITLAPPLPASFPSVPIRSSTSAASTSTPATRRESAIIACEQLDAPKPHRASVRLSRAFTIPARAPPPPPIATSSASSSAAPRTPSPTASPRPPPRTPVPTDADDFATDPTRLSLFASTSNASTSLAALLSPPPQFAFGFPPAGVPSDVEDGDEGVWEEVELEEMEVEVELACADEDEREDAFDEVELERADEQEREDAFDEVPLSPFVAADAQEPTSTPKTPASALRSRWSASTSALSPPSAANPRLRPPLALVSLHIRAHDPGLRPPPLPLPMDTIPETPALPRSRWSASTAAPSPALRSRWSSSTLSSIHSAHAAAASPRTFSFRGARRYFPLPSPKKRAAPKSSAPAFASTSMAPYANPRAHARPMGSAAAAPPRKKQRKLTVADVQVPHLLPVVGHPPATPSVLASACAAPDVFSTPMTPATAVGAMGGVPGVAPARARAAPHRHRGRERGALRGVHDAAQPAPARLECVERERVVRAVAGRQQQ